MWASDFNCRRTNAGAASVYVYRTASATELLHVGNAQSGDDASVTEVVGLAINQPRLETAAGEPDRERITVVVASLAVLRRWQPTHLSGSRDTIVSKKTGQKTDEQHLVLQRHSQNDGFRISVWRVDDRDRSAETALASAHRRACLCQEAW